MTLFEILQLLLEVFYNRLMMYVIIGAVIINYDNDAYDAAQKAMRMHLNELLNLTNNTFKNITSRMINNLMNTTDILKVIPIDVEN